MASSASAQRDAPPAGFGRGSAAIVAFVTGVGVLTLEVTAARVLMPWFGASTVVWTNVIGVTLGAVAVGNLLGGRIADRTRSVAWLAGLLVAAGALAAAFPFLVPTVSSVTIPQDLPLEAALPLLHRGSLLVCLIALAPALVLLGAVSPFLVRAAAEPETIGRSAGLMSGMATLGSLVGTWAPVHYLIPWMGSKRTCLVAGVILAATGAVLFLRSHRTRRVVGSVVVAGAMFGVAESTSPRPERGATEGRVVTEIETRYQYARVERFEDRTILKLNEGLDSFHSYTIDGRLLTDRYYDPFLLVPQWIEQDGDTFDVLILGFAAGTFARQLLGLYADAPSLRIVGVELDPEVSALGFQHFGLPRDSRLHVITDQDARVYLSRSTQRFELILVDVYADQIYIPFHTCSVEFFQSALAHLTSSGVLAANLGGFTLEDRPLTAIRNTAAAVFGDVSLIRCPNSRNYMLLAARNRVAPNLEDSSALDNPELEPLVALFRDPTLRRDFKFDPNERTLTDDESPIEELANIDFFERSARAFLAADDTRAR